ncbi:hypothetical protein [Methylobacterium oxalidis]|uniref:Uncharacterized protein n=1 Tax=Methylobacterium oxalidis TaxID=944322 RepID=A0A512IZD0_9HYPH|nr:hypothetical protein [Methylobacterium oxalidis]GEP03071.1 hypothetical protein MOX02_11090 [Methylobacterium oxalidis]GJE32837.1 hypothetical protein LDDCCGHA_3033 [Methylobacterium oxalidis]GLS67330.1 hypothetical protein GCM10007888_57140 [Methylobacterium oxalidis]
MRLARIEPVPKRVEFITLADGSFATRPGIDLERFLDNILDIRRHIVSGHPLPEHYYRRSRGRDHLPESRGWLHLRVGHGIDDDVLLIVEQTADCVLFIGLTNHDIFKERPRGRSLLRLGSRIAKAKLPRKPVR